MATLGYSFYPVHPGEIIKDEMEARKISQREFARQVDMSYTVLNELLNGKRSLSPANVSSLFRLIVEKASAKLDG